MALYDDIIAAETAPKLGADPRFQGSLELNTDVNPDEIAKQRGVARQLGVPAAAVEAMPAESMKAARIKQIDDSTLNAPVLREKYTDADFAKLAHDDAPALAGFEGALSALGSAAKWVTSAPGTEGSNLFSFTKRGTTNLVGGATVGLGAQIMDVGAVGYDVLSAATSWALPEDVFGRQANIARGAAVRARESLDVLQGGKATNSTQAAIDSGLRSTGTNLAMLPVGIEAAAAKGAEYAGRIVAGMMSAGVGAEAFNKAREKGMDRIGAATYAIPQAAFEYAFEQVPASRLLNDIAKNSGFLRTVANQLVPEVLGEQATTVLQDLNEQVRLNPDKTFRQFIEERPDAAYQTLVATLVGIGTQSAVVRAFAPAQQADMQRQIDVQRTEQSVEQLQDLFTRAADSKLRERDPETFQDLVQNVADSDLNSAPKTVFIDGTALAETLQQSGVTEQQLAEMLPSVPAQLEQATATGGVVEIPLGELLARVAGTGLEGQLLQHIRMTPDALSQTEAKEASAEAANMLAADAQRVIADSVVGVERATSAAVVQETILSQLKSTGRFTDDVNTAYATLVRDFYTATSARLNITPEEMYAQYPLKIGATAPAGVTLNQEATPEQNVQAQAERIANGEPTAEVLAGISDPAVAQQVQDTAAKLGKYQQAILAGRSLNELSLSERNQYAALTPSTFQQTARGTFNPATLEIALLERADLSTFLHESGHAFLEILSDIASRPNPPAEVAQDMDTLLKWFNVESVDTWRGMTLNQQRASHEKFAESFEQYLFEGKAPSRELQSLFGRFRAWMINVYKSMSDFMREHDTQLSDDVRGVFDRLLADADQIRDAQRSASFAPLFESIADSGMSIEEWEAYQATGAKATTDALDGLQARSMRDMQWLTNARGKVLSKLQREAKSKRKAVEAEVAAEVDAEPTYAAMRWLKTGILPDGTQTAGGKLSTTALREMFGENPAAPWRYLSTDMIAAQDGLHPDVVAEILGYESGDQLVRAIVNAQPRAVEIEGRTDQRMLERYGDIATPQAQARAANEAIHNEARARFIATELRSLQEATNPREQVGTDRRGRPITVNALVEAAKQFASRMVAQRKVRDIRPAQHAAAERRAGSRVEKAMATGDTTAAVTAKRDQLLNNFATKLSYDALAEVDRSVKYLNRVADTDTLPADYKDQIDKMLDRYDIRRSVTLTSLDKRASLLEWVEEQRENGIEPNIPAELLNEAQRISYKDMTLEEFRGLVDSIKQIEHIGRLKNKLLTAKDKRDFEQVRDTIVQSIVDNGKGRVADTRTPNTVLGESLVGLKKFWANHIKAATWARVMDGGKDGGPVWEYIIRAGNEAGNKETGMIERSTKDLAALIAPVLKQGKMGGKGTHFPTIGRSMNKEGVLTMALNTGNDSNLQRLLGGEGWTMDQVRPVLDTLTAEDWKFVQGVWDYFESFRPEIAAKERRVNGVEPAWIPPVSRVEQGVMLRGGYYPVKYDPRASARAESHADAEAARAQMKGAYTSSTTRRSFTKERVDAVLGRPLLYSLDGLYSGVQEVIHDLSWHEFLIDGNRLIKDAGISSVMRNTYGPEAHGQFKSWLQDTAQGYAQANTNTEAFAGFIRQGVSVSGLGFNLMSALIQPIGLTQSVVRIGARHTGKGVMEYIASPIGLADKINAKSEFMRTRSMTRLREIAEVRSQVKGKSKTRQAVDGSAYFLMMKAQSVVDLPTWWGGYEKAIGEGHDEARAVALADQGVIDSQGSGGIKDQAAIERGGPALKLFTVFYSFFNTALNVAVTTTMTTDSKAKLAADYALIFVVPTILGALLKDAITPGDSGDWDDPKKIAKKLAGEQLSFMFGMMVGVRELTAAIQVATGTNQYGSDYSGPAGLRPIADLVKLGKQANQGEMDDGLRKAIINTAGQALRLPSAQINRSITGAQALAEGKTKNPSALVLGFQEEK